MCIIAAKYFKDFGWVGVKNRDRNYLPEVIFKQSFRNDIERLYLEDVITHYTEGINEYGVSILSAATMVKSDEKEAQLARNNKAKKILNGVYRSRDGKIIRTALFEKTPKAALGVIIENELRGNTIVFNKEDCYLIEADTDLETKKTRLKNPDKEIDKPGYEYQYKKISHDDVAVRTNHGIFISYSGYQSIGDEKMKKSRISSEKRYEQTLKDIKNVENPSDMLNAISNLDNKNSQLNPIRLGDPENKEELKTTGQIMISPNIKTISYKPIWCKTIIDFQKINDKKSKTYLSIIPFNWDNALKESDFKSYLKIKNLIG